MKALNKNNFHLEFSRCCDEYDNLKIATAWCGQGSKSVLPYGYLMNDKLKIEIVLGIGNNFSHPDGIRFFMENADDVKIFDYNNFLYHPKFYLFNKKDKYALFLGSSNFTNSGFFSNIEVNIMYEGKKNEAINELENLFSSWQNSEYSFTPDEVWLKKYRVDYEKRRDTEKDNKITTEKDKEEDIPESNWLLHADWNYYHKSIFEHLNQSGEEDESGYNMVLDKAEESLRIPLSYTIFDTIEMRRLLGGMKSKTENYGYLGHVAASFGFRKFMANGAVHEKKKAVNAINIICSQTDVIDYNQIQENLENLEKLGPSIKVWSRIITLIRPDIFCTISSISFRKNLSEIIKVSQTSVLFHIE